MGRLENAFFNRKKSFLFFCFAIRYHNTRQVATRQKHNNMDQRSVRQTANRANAKRGR